MKLIGGGGKDKILVQFKITPSLLRVKVPV